MDNLAMLARKVVKTIIDKCNELRSKRSEYKVIEISATEVEDLLNHKIKDSTIRLLIYTEVAAGTIFIIDFELETKIHSKNIKVRYLYSVIALRGINEEEKMELYYITKNLIKLADMAAPELYKINNRFTDSELTITIDLYDGVSIRIKQIFEALNTREFVPISMHVDIGLTKLHIGKNELPEDAIEYFTTVFKLTMEQIKNGFSMRKALEAVDIINSIANQNKIRLYAGTGMDKIGEKDSVVYYLIKKTVNDEQVLMIIDDNLNEIRGAEKDKLIFLYNMMCRI